MLVKTIPDWASCHLVEWSVHGLISAAAELRGREAYVALGPLGLRRGAKGIRCMQPFFIHRGEKSRISPKLHRHASGIPTSRACGRGLAVVPKAAEDTQGDPELLGVQAAQGPVHLCDGRGDYCLRWVQEPAD